MEGGGGHGSGGSGGGGGGGWKVMVVMVMMMVGGTVECCGDGVGNVRKVMVVVVERWKVVVVGRGNI